MKESAETTRNRSTAPVAELQRERPASSTSSRHKTEAKARRKSAPARQTHADRVREAIGKSYMDNHMLELPGIQQSNPRRRVAAAAHRNAGHRRDDSPKTAFQKTP